MAYDFDMVVIGGGAAGLTAAGISASLGARTALIEARRLGGDCTWFGCIPSKTLLHAAQAGETFHAAMEKVRRVRQHVYEEADAPPVIAKLGIEVMEKRARFVDSHSIEAGGVRVSSRYFVIATGSTPRLPDIPGVAAERFLTNETVFQLVEMPRSLVILGAGPVGIEMAQAFRRFGAEVTVVGHSPRILPRDDAELAGMLEAHLRRAGIRFLLGRHADAADLLRADAVLAATGRRSDVSSLNLSAAGIVVGADGIQADHRCRTNVHHIFAAGDVAARYRFTHMAEHTAKVAVTNALLHFPLSIDERGVAWCTFTEPEFAHAGRTEEQLRQSGTRYEVYRFPYARIDRAVTDEATVGMIKVFARPWDGRVYGATILGARAGDLIAEYALAIRHRITLRRIADTIHPYPTYALGNRRAADQWYVRRQSPAVVRWLQRIFGYRGAVPPPPDPDRIL